MLCADKSIYIFFIDNLLRYKWKANYAKIFEENKRPTSYVFSIKLFLNST